jgi:DNA adenine methylase
MKINDGLATSNYVPLRPFLRWAGGKQKLVRFLREFVPDKEVFHRYFEPFFGAGAIFFIMQPENAMLSDINSELMNCYQQVAIDPESVAYLLQQLAIRDCADFFYRVRAQCMENMTPEERVARFIYLNKAAFNGIYRVNKMGCFNVPYGPSFKGPAIPSKDVLISAANRLRKAKIFTRDFEEVLADATTGDFIYLDPPYPPLNNTSYFTHYSPQKFNWQDQMRVANLFLELSNRGCLVMLSNSGQSKVINLYKKFNIFNLNVRRWLGSNGDRFHVHEIIVTNYNPSEVSHRE